MKFELLEIPGLNASDQTCWKIRALAIDGASIVLKTLSEWEVSERADFNKIMKVMRTVGQVQRVHSEKKVKKCSNPKYKEVHEMRADKGHARLMFFYSDDDETLVICTNAHWKEKSKGSQDTAFRHCSELRQLYLSERN